MNYARVEDGVVREVIDFDPAGLFHHSLVWVLCNTGTAQGDLYDGAVFTNPPLFATAAPSAAQVAITDAKAAAKADTVVQYLRDHTPAECEAYVQTNVTDLASARALMKKFAVVLCVLAKQGLQ